MTVYSQAPIVIVSVVLLLLCLSVIILLMGKKCKYHKLLLNTVLVFSDNSKAYGKILLGFTFSGGNQCDDAN